METSKISDAATLSRLFKISGGSRNPTPEDYFFVSQMLHHNNAEIRERAIFISGLRWMDITMIGYLIAALLGKSEEDPENRRLMIEAIVSYSIVRNPITGIEKLLIWMIENEGPTSISAKASYIGLKRLRGEMTTQQFAITDYEQVVIPQQYLK